MGIAPLCAESWRVLTSNTLRSRAAWKRWRRMTGAITRRRRLQALSWRGRNETGARRQRRAGLGPRQRTPNLARGRNRTADTPGGPPRPVLRQPANVGLSPDPPPPPLLRGPGPPPRSAPTWQPQPRLRAATSGCGGSSRPPCRPALPGTAVRSSSPREGTSGSSGPRRPVELEVGSRP